MTHVDINVGDKIEVTDGRNFVTLVVRSCHNYARPGEPDDWYVQGDGADLLPVYVKQIPDNLTIKIIARKGEFDETD